MIHRGFLEQSHLGGACFLLRPRETFQVRADALAVLLACQALIGDTDISREGAVAAEGAKESEEPVFEPWQEVLLESVGVVGGATAQDRVGGMVEGE